MIFKKKKRMIDVRELQRRGVVNLPKKDIIIPTNKEGFIEFAKPKTNNLATDDSSNDNAELFGFMNSPSNPSSGENGYSKREVDEKLTNLDNKIYKLEQRIELLERKLDISSSTDSNVGPMGW